MAQIVIRLMSEFQSQGFNDALKAIGELETKYKSSFKKGKLDLSGSVGNISAFKKNYASLLGLKTEDATADANAYANAWLKAYTLNFSGSNAKQARNQVEKILASLTNIGGTEAVAGIDTAGLNENLKALDGFFKQAEESATRGTSAIAKQMQRFSRIFSGIAMRSFVLLTARTIKQTITDAVKLAAEAEQVFNKLETVFAGMATTADKATSSLANSIGVAKSTAASAMSTVGDLLQAQGMSVSDSLKLATEWTQQFQDIIAFKDINMSLEEFAQSFMAGAAGNTRNFRTFGSIVKETAVQAELAKRGLDGLTGSELELEKMTIRAELALKQQANAIGATQREWNTTLSVNRRLNEQWKEYKENLGKSISQVLTPLKQTWADILTNINKANKAQQEFNEGKKDITVYDIVGNVTDYNKLSGTLNNILTGAVQNRQTNIAERYRAAYGLSETPQTVLNEFVETLTKFGAFNSEESFDKAIENATDFIAKNSEQFKQLGIDTETFTKNLKQTAKETWNLAQAQKEQERRYSESEPLVEGLNLLAENLGNIQGVSTAGTETYLNQAEWVSGRYTELYSPTSIESFNKAMDDIFQWLVSDLTSSFTENVQTAMADSTQAVKIFGSTMQDYLGESDPAEIYKTMQDSTKALFEAVWNEYQKADDIQKEFLQKELDSLVETYNQITDASDKYAASLQAIAYIEDKLATAQQTSWEKQLRQQYKSAGYSSGQTDIEMKYNSQLKEFSDKLLASEQTSLTVNGEEYTEARYWSEYLEPLMKKELAEYRNSINPLNSAMESLQNSLAGQIATGAAQGAEWGGTWGAILGALMPIVENTEAFQELLKIAEPLVPIFDKLLRPLVPAIEIIVQMVTELIDTLMPVLFPIIKGIALVLAALAYPIKFVSNVIYNVYALVNNILEFIKHPARASRRNNMEYKSLNDGMDAINKVLKDIYNMEYDIRENTKPSERAQGQLDELLHMFQEGLINASEYDALLNDIKGITTDRVKTTDKYAWQQGSGGTTIVYQDKYEIVINGTNLTAEQIAEALRRNEKYQRYSS